jgi:hypothetical protein
MEIISRHCEKPYETSLKDFGNTALQPVFFFPGLLNDGFCPEKETTIMNI